MRKLGNVLMLVAAIAVLAQTARAEHGICCGTNGWCEYAAALYCSPDACPAGTVCDESPGARCGSAVAGCRLRNGDCIYANQGCVRILRCTPDAACLMAEDPEGTQEEVTWCDADGPEVAGDTPCEDENGVEDELAKEDAKS